MKSVLCTLLTILTASTGAAETAQAQAQRTGDRMENAMERPGLSEAGPLTTSVAREATRLAGGRRSGTSAARTISLQPGQPSSNWIRRHPVWFGTIVGAVAGAAIVGAAWHPEASFVGFFGGGAIGAVAGAVIGR